MKKQLIAALATIFASTTFAQAPAFPGAEGFARYITGGRGGTVYHVTNLNDKGTGSLREALGKSGKRTIVFDVSGTINLASDLKISKGDVTVAGQTAPGDGITLANYTVTIAADNVIIRFIRFRRGNAVNINDGADAIWGRQRKNIMLDHCSFSWSIDEVASFYDNRTFTMQWCTVAEALTNAGHDKGAHGYGGIWGGKEASFHHNFLLHLQNRVPRFNGARYDWSGYDTSKYPNTIQAERVDFRNCVMFNWGTGGCYGGPGGGYINMVNNYYKAGPATTNKTRVTQISKSDSSNGGDNPFPGYTSRYYINGNYVTAAGENAENYDWQGVVYDSGLPTVNGVKCVNDSKNYYGEGAGNIPIKIEEPIDAGEVTTHSATVAFEKVLAYAGASYRRDAVDARYAQEAETGEVVYTGSVTGKPGIIDTQNDVGGWPVLNKETKPTDTDKDGMPDDWETANGLNPSLNDSKLYTVDAEKIYTNLEVYMNSLVQDIMIAGNADAIDAVQEYYPAYTKADGTYVPAINGKADGITEVYTGRVVETQYFNLQGMRVESPSQGIFIRVDMLDNGKKRVNKVVMP
ncbi:MAG: pectate lyase [Bacteroidaceae bacterium]|nr:pectate lyase [Bacteroidaceae bacterium]